MGEEANLTISVRSLAKASRANHLCGDIIRRVAINRTHE
jgi:hypothetical protein